MLMKVLIIQPWISYRGAETISLLQAIGLQKLGIKTSVAALFVDKTRMSPEFHNINYILPPKTLSKLFSSSRLLFYILGFPVLSILILKNMNSFEVLNPHNLPSHWICAFLKLIKQKYTVWTVHGITAKITSTSTIIQKILWFFIKPLDYWATRRMDAIVSESEKVKKEVKKMYGRDSVVIYPAISQNDFKISRRSNGIKQKYGLNDKDFLLLHASYLHPAKNVDLSILTLKKVLNTVPQAKLIVAGEGPSKNQLRHLVDQMGLEKKVIFTGHIMPNKIGNFYKISDLLLVPYFETEGCSSVPFEALLVGRPSIVAKNSGADEIIGEKNLGIVSEPGNAAFTKAVLSFIRNRDKWEDRLKNNKDFIAKNLSAGAYAKNFLSKVINLKKSVV